MSDKVEDQAPTVPPPPRQLSELTLRTLVGVALIAIALVAVVLGGLPLWLLMVIAALFMMAEWCDLVGVQPRTKRMAQLALSVPLAIMSPIAAGAGFLALGFLAGAFFFIGAVTRRPWLASGVMYCGLPVLSLIVIRRQEIHGVEFAIWALALVWLTDIGAYFAGRTIGGPKLAPRVSPNKTWAGLIGGVVAAGAWGVFMHWYVELPLRLTLASPFLAVAAQAGDLFESWLKRRAGVKDSGNILPGHGGVLDRLDGLVPVAPLAALLVVAPHFYR